MLVNWLHKLSSLHAGGDDERKKLYEGVADRLLDLVRVRSASADECLIADAILSGEDYSALGFLALEANLQEKKAKLFPECGNQDDESLSVNRVVKRLLMKGGQWDRKVEDSVPTEIQPLHMSAVREALGALIPENLHKNQDNKAAKAKIDYSTVQGKSNLFMSGWKVDVRAEDALGRGTLENGAFEFFLKALERICQSLKLPLMIASMTVGKAVGKQEQAAGLLQLAQERWRMVWSSDFVRATERLLLPVAVDEKKFRLVVGNG